MDLLGRTSERMSIQEILLHLTMEEKLGISYDLQASFTYLDKIEKEITRLHKFEVLTSEQRSEGIGNLCKFRDVLTETLKERAMEVLRRNQKEEIESN